MTIKDVLNLLEASRDERGIKHWQQLGKRTGGLESFGIGLTNLRKLAKKNWSQSRSRAGVVAKQRV